MINWLSRRGLEDRMIDRGDMIRTFGSDNIRTMDFETAREVGASDENLFILVQVGLPRDAGPLFTTETTSPPKTFTAQQFKTPEDEVSVALFLGRPRDDRMMRYFLDIKKRYVALFAMDDNGNAESEIINSSLSDFLEFIYMIGARYYGPPHADAEAAKKENQELSIALMERDAFAFRRPDSWWSMAINQIHKSTEHE
jgi:hypothetical protein